MQSHGFPAEDQFSQDRLQHGALRCNDFKINFKQKYKFSGKYGTNLMEEVARYALVGGTIALQNDFDIIHAHDWLTYAAGVAAKRLTGKPLVVHVHATEFDRTGENVNTQVYALEKMGMEAADRVITVSNLTRNIVINRYGISPPHHLPERTGVLYRGRQQGPQIL